jgi:hypothetical protein
VLSPRSQDTADGHLANWPASPGCWQGLLAGTTCADASSARTLAQAADGKADMLPFGDLFETHW